MGESTEGSVQKDYDYCKQVIKKHSKSFYYAFSQLPKERAQAVYAIYAFCRRADDTVDEEPRKEEQSIRLDKLEQELMQFEEGKSINDPMWRALKDVFIRFDMTIQPFYEQIQGQRMDIVFSAPQTIDELEKYSYYVAGTVGLMLLPIIAVKHEKEARKSAVSLGKAMQLTNILRDVGEDLNENKRIYLPVSIREQEGVTEVNLANGIVNSEFIQVWEQLATRAEELYAEFKADIYLYDIESQLPVLTSAMVYRGILDAVRKNNYNCFEQRNYVSPVEMEQLMRAAKSELKKIETS